MYRHFARVYDLFMGTMPYEHWAGYIDAVFAGHGVPRGGLVLDLACGTGTMAFLIAQKGYELIAVDASADMLSEAYNKMHEQANILFLNQDMLKLDLYGTVDAAYSTCDAMNYILTEEDFGRALKNVALYLNPGGIFIFDLKTEHKYRQLGSNTYYDYTDAASYIWKNSYNPCTAINEYQVKFIFHGEGVYSEVHHQRAYSTKTVSALAQQAGLRLLSVCDDYSHKPARPDSNRLTYILEGGFK